mgnify:CR=1 FL=1
MGFEYINNIIQGRCVGKSVSIRGWVYRIRKQKYAVFIILRDHSGIIQVVIKDEKMIKEAEKITIESSLEISGTVRVDNRAPGGYEIDVSAFKIIGIAERFPIVKDQSEEFLREMRHLWIRSRKMTNTLKIRSAVFQAIREFYMGKGFYEIQSPIFTSSACEGGSTLFEVKFPNKDRKVYLSQSWQLYAEAMIYSLEKIFTIAPSFRAEKSHTIRHLAEYWHHEMEAAWMDFEELLKFQEELIVFIAHYVAEKCGCELKEMGVDISRLKNLSSPFKRITYEQAIKKLGKKWGEDVTDVEERQLAAEAGGPVFLTHFPRELKAFYMRPDPKNQKVVLATDLLVPGVGEITGGSERIYDIKELLESIKIFKLKKEDYEWYIDLRRYGTIPHSGFGLGIERLIMWLTGAAHIFETIPFPRTIDRVYP